MIICSNKDLLITFSSRDKIWLKSKIKFKITKMPISVFTVTLSACKWAQFLILKSCHLQNFNRRKWLTKHALQNKRLGWIIQSSLVFHPKWTTLIFLTVIPRQWTLQTTWTMLNKLCKIKRHNLAIFKGSMIVWRLAAFNLLSIWKWIKLSKLRRKIPWCPSRLPFLTVFARVIKQWGGAL